MICFKVETARYSEQLVDEFLAKLAKYGITWDEATSLGYSVEIKENSLQSNKVFIVPSDDLFNLLSQKKESIKQSLSPYTLSVLQKMSEQKEISDFDDFNTVWADDDNKSIYATFYGRKEEFCGEVPYGEIKNLFLLINPPA